MKKKPVLLNSNFKLKNKVINARKINDTKTALKKKIYQIAENIKNKDIKQLIIFYNAIMCFLVLSNSQVYVGYKI